MKPPKDRIIFPLDVSGFDEAMTYVELLKEHVGLFKVGLELFISEGPRIIEPIRNAGAAGIFLDLKLHDIPATVKRAFTAACALRPRFVTIHCDEGQDTLRRVAENNQGETQILAVTVLTSLDPKKLKALGYSEKYVQDIPALVLLRARMAKEAGCHGVICSGHEVARIKEELGSGFIVVTPGIRPSWAVVGRDDQKRIVTPEVAVRAGADYLVIGRPIRDAKDPAGAAKRVAQEIGAAL